MMPEVTYIPKPTKKAQLLLCDMRKNVTDICYEGVLDATHAAEEDDLRGSLKNLEEIKKMAKCKEKGN